MVTPPPIATAKPTRAQHRVGRRGPTEVVTGDDDETSRLFQSAAAFLVSATLHLIIFVLLALTVRKELSPVIIEMTMTRSMSDEPIAFQAFAIPRTDDLPTDDAPVDIAALKSEILESFDEVEIEPPAAENYVSTSAAQRKITTNRRDQNAEKKPDVTFFGTHAYGNKFVYVLDASGSMMSGAGVRMRRARAELVRSIYQLTPEHSFYVVMYCDYAIQMFGKQDQVKLMTATSENKRRAAEWIARVGPRGGTKPGKALKIAGELLPDAVFFLSDGEFIYEPPATTAVDQFLQGFGPARPRRFRKELKNAPYPKLVLNAYASGIVVHTVALESENNRALMATIAETKGGQHRFIPALDRSTFTRRRPAVR